MSQREPRKQKILALARLIVTETDPDHGLTMPEIVARLAEEGVHAERKALYRDLEALRSVGLDIGVRRTNPAVYYLASRTFDVSELALIADAVQSSRFLTRKQADGFVDRLKTLVSSHEAWRIDGSIHV